MNYCQWSPTLGELEDTAENVWGTPKYEGDLDDPTVFFGLYGLPDFYKLWRHRGKKWILWAGSDIVNFTQGYWLEEGGDIRLNPDPLSEWISKNCENWVENMVESRALAECGIETQVTPSFLGRINEYKVSYTRQDRPRVYISANPEREIEYGWKIIEDIADKCDVDFYLYGSSSWKTKRPNVIIRGRLRKDIMNEEIQDMQCGLRLNEGMDGFSEITAKSALWGQYPIVRSGFEYPLIDSFITKEELIVLLNDLKNKKKPNYTTRKHYRENLNLFPWTK